MKRFSFSVLMGLIAVSVSAQHTHEAQRPIQFPDTRDFVTLSCDFHIHTVFSDGSVWPNIRVQEAIRDGLDAISLTEHLEYQPHSDDIPHPDRNRSYDLAIESAGNSGLIVVKGSEITRSLPPGHANAIFVSDSNLLLKDDPIEVYREANRQGAFTFWNHPAWTSQQADGIATLSPLHHQLIREGLLNGIEVVNTGSYSEEALQIALDYDLTILGTSDVHGLIDWDYEVPFGGHRPVTLVLAAERSEEGIKQALVAGRTVVWFDNTLIGQEENMSMLVGASLEISASNYIGDSQLLSVGIRNTSDAMFVMKYLGDYSFDEHTELLMLQPHETTMLSVRTVDRLPAISLSFEVLNAIIAPRQHLTLTLEATVQ